MKIYSIELKAKTPLVITGPKYGRVVKHSTSYIPGSSIRGAILTLLKFMNSKLVDEEILNPRMIFHPAYPIDEDGSLTYPADPLTSKCKICGRISRKPIEPFKVPIRCSGDHICVPKNIGGTLICYRENEVRSFKLKYVLIESVGINKVLKSSEVGLLYSYVALAPRTSFRGLIIDPEDRFEPMIKDSGLNMNSLELKIGRRTSAGLGHVDARIIEDKNYIDRRVKQLSKAEGTLCLLARSPIFTFDYDENDIFLTIKNVKGITVRYVFKTGVTGASGYSIGSNTPKVMIRGLNIGSLIVPDKADLNDLIKLELYGIGPFSTSGLNIVEVVAR